MGLEDDREPGAAVLCVSITPASEASRSLVPVAHVIKPLGLDELKNAWQSRSALARCSRGPPHLGQRDARPQAAARGLAGGQLEHGSGTPATRCPPRTDRRRNLHDPVRAVEEDRVDGEAHEGRVDRSGRPEQHPLTGGETSTPEQAAQASERGLREETPLADDGPVVARQHDLRQLEHQCPFR
jgi:hypothetical protein